MGGGERGGGGGGGGIGSEICSMEWTSCSAYFGIVVLCCWSGTVIFFFFVCLWMLDASLFLCARPARLDHLTHLSTSTLKNPRRRLYGHGPDQL